MYTSLAAISRPFFYSTTISIDYDSKFCGHALIECETLDIYIIICPVLCAVHKKSTDKT